MTPLVIDIRLVQLRDGRWRVRMGGSVHEAPAAAMATLVGALVRDAVSPRSYARTRFSECPVTERAES